MQNALEKAAEDITSLAGYDLKEVMGTGTGASINNRNWELGEQTGIIHRLSQSRTIAHEMEPAPTGANGYHC
jgi:AMP nucleosidase